MKEFNYSKINYGFCLLKMLLAFEVLLGHFVNWDEYNPLIVWPFRELVSLAVPCFVIMSFYLTAKNLFVRDDQAFKRRFIRLLVPQIGWTIIYYIIYTLLDLTLNRDYTNSFADFLWQLFTGHSMTLNPSMWYQVDVILVTSLFYLIYRYNKNNNHAYICIIVLTMFCYHLQFSGINRALFGNLRYELKYPLGRIVEVIPFAFIGISLKLFNIFEKLKKRRYISMLLCIVLFFIAYNIPWTVLKDFGFAGFCKPFLTLCIVTFAYLSPLEYLPINKKMIILKMTDFTLGIYCIHRLINTLLSAFYPKLYLHSFERCVLLYCVCYFVCYLIDRIPLKYSKQLVK